MRNLKPYFNLVEEFEGFHSKPYLCPAGIPTIGYGTTAYPGGRPVELTDPEITKDQGYEYMVHHMKNDIFYLEKFFTVHKISLNDNQFCALLDFSYNCGTAPITTSGKMINRGLTQKNNKLIEDGIMAYTWATVNGKRKQLNGLKRRRKAEVALYFS